VPVVTVCVVVWAPVPVVVPPPLLLLHATARLIANTAAAPNAQVFMLDLQKTLRLRLCRREVEHRFRRRPQPSPPPPRRPTPRPAQRGIRVRRSPYATPSLTRTTPPPQPCWGRIRAPRAHEVRRALTAECYRASLRGSGRACRAGGRGRGRGG